MLLEILDLLLYSTYTYVLLSVDLRLSSTDVHNTVAVRFLNKLLAITTVDRGKFDFY